MHINEMPDIPYRFILPVQNDPQIYVDKFDRGILPEMQYVRYIEKMKAAGFDVEVHKFDFCNCPLPENIRENAADMIFSMLCGGQK